MTSTISSRRCHHADSEIGFLHLPIAGDLGERAFADLAAVVEHHAAIGDALDHAHLVLDDDDGQAGDAAAHGEDVVHQVARFLVRHAGGGLVEQHKARPADQRAADLDAPSIDHRQAGRRLVHALGQRAG